MSSCLQLGDRQVCLVHTHTLTHTHTLITERIREQVQWSRCKIWWSETWRRKKWVGLKILEKVHHGIGLDMSPRTTVKPSGDSGTTGANLGIPTRSSPSTHLSPSWPLCPGTSNPSVLQESGKGARDSDGGQIFTFPGHVSSQDLGEICTACCSFIQQTPTEQTTHISDHAEHGQHSSQFPESRSSLAPRPPNPARPQYLLGPPP